MQSCDRLHGVMDTLLPCANEAYITLERLCEACPTAEVGVSMNSHFNSHDNTVRGWYTRLHPDTAASMVPFSSNMFEGVTVVETLAEEGQILDLLKNKHETLTRVQETVQRFLPKNNTHRPSWVRCRPQRAIPLQKTNTWHVVMRPDHLARYTTVSASGDSVSVAHDAPLDLVPDDTVPNYVDAAQWSPELSVGGCVGLYHQWHTNYQGNCCHARHSHTSTRLTGGCGGAGKRELKLYFVCHSSCQMAGLEIKQIVNDIPHETSAYALACSEEIWWLQNVNMRNRKRLIAELAAELGITVPLVEDTHACNTVCMAQSMAESFIHGIYNYRDGCVGVANECVPTRLVSNGIVCKMSPWEGFFLFKGPHASAAHPFGTAFGGNMDVFPAAVLPMDRKTESVARRLRYIVHSSSPAVQDCWADTAFRHAPVREAAAADAAAHDDTDSSDAAEDTRVSQGFSGVSDPAFFEIALSAWRKAKQAALTGNEKPGEMQRPTGDSPELCFMSFDDNVVLNALCKTSWDQRNGVLRLLPLCVVTHGLFRHTA